MAGDLRDPKYQEQAVITANTAHIIDDLVAGFIASLPAEEVYHRAQERGFTWGAVRAPEQLLDDPHLYDRGFWKEVGTRNSDAASSIPARPRSITARRGGSRGERR